MPCRNLTSFFWTHKFGLVPWLFQEHPETLTGKTGRPLGIAPQTIPTPKWGVFCIILAKSIAQRQKPTLTVGLKTLKKEIHTFFQKFLKTQTLKIFDMFFLRAHEFFENTKPNFFDTQRFTFHEESKKILENEYLVFSLRLLVKCHNNSQRNRSFATLSDKNILM